jgi:hypothetical protein
VIAPSVCHGPPISRCQSKRTIAPCGRTIRNCSARHPGDSWSASLRFIQCKKCRQLGKRGRFELVFWWREQTRFKWRDQLQLPMMTANAEVA